ncbi:putative alpha/beta superfamily hydrolase [Sphingomonas kaistensis]|uniref:Putative alpha/beta superfamily hydrolase n=1 Tax=Sphingomonas kaistensis TaxID=298708 RepID=A0A7X5Y3Y6_9SPHN|nr:alpha/beta hydrolase-fold protein [Sphingomonas kaistensis]NJC04278.1 putative alpha/beta superfamily hydrolase [Sphingomonas kaistensis]
MRWLLAIAALIFVLVSPAGAQGRFVEFDQPADIGQVHVTVWLPLGYDRAPGRRYPVLYMHDGQNVFFPKRSGFNKVWAADKAALKLIAAREVAPFMIVAVDHPGAPRYLRYFPTRVANPEFAKGIAGFAKGKLAGDDYLTFLAGTLKPRIDRDYRTRPQPRFTAVAGSSMGGLISLYALTERADIFGKAAAVSTHSPLVDPGLLTQQPQMAEMVKADWRRYVASRLGAPRGRKLWMDHGTETLDAGYAPYQAVLDESVASAGWMRGKDFESRVYKGTAHEENAWAARLPEILGWLLSDWKP